ncbi:MAG: trigger factor [Acidimicrobiales bacterium]
MRSQVAPVEGNKVKVSVQVDETEVEQAVNEAFARYSREVRVPGFRPGHVPRRVLEARFGLSAVRREAFNEHIPEWYAQAVREHEVDVIAQAEVEVTDGQESGPLSFDAVVEVRPEIKLEGYEHLRVVVPSPEVSQEEVDAQIDRLRGNFAELAPVEREVRPGDHVVIDMTTSRNGDAVAGMSYTDYSVEVGSGNDLPELDEHLPGAKAGDTLRFKAEVGGDEPADVEVTVKQVQEKILPEANDEWAAEASEFSTYGELEDDVRRRLSDLRRAQAVLSLQSAVADGLAGLVSEDPPTSLVDAEVQRMAEDLGRRLDAQKVSLERYLRATNRTIEQVLAELRERAVPNVKVDLALRAVARAENLEPTEEELDGYLARLAEEAGASLANFKQDLQAVGRLPAVRSELRKSKAFDWLVEHADIVDEKGRPVDRALLQLEAQPPDAGGASPGRQEPATVSSATGRQA